MIASLVVFFGLAEGAARWGGYVPPKAQADVFDEAFEQTGHADSELFVASPARIWDLRPGFVGRRDDWGSRSWVLLAINSQGRRDKEVPLKKPAGTYRIALLGDSVSFGSRVEVKDNFATQMEWNLNARSSSTPYQVLNFSVPGYGTWQELSMLKERALAYEPDMVMVSMVMNDLYDNNHAGNMGYLDMTRLQGLAKFLREHSAFYRFMRDKLLSVEAQVALRNPCLSADEMFCWDTTKQLLDQIVDITRQRGIKLVVLVFPARSQTLVDLDAGTEAQYQLKMAEYARDRDVFVIDLLDALRAHRDDGMFVDDYHLTEAGHAITTIEVLEQLKLRGMLAPQ